MNMVKRQVKIVLIFILALHVSNTICMKKRFGSFGPLRTGLFKIGPLKTGPFEKRFGSFNKIINKIVKKKPSKKEIVIEADIENWVQEKLEYTDKKRVETVQQLLNIDINEKSGFSVLKKLVDTGFSAVSFPEDLLRENPKILKSSISREKLRFFIKKYNVKSLEDFKNKFYGSEGVDFEKTLEFKLLYNHGRRLSLGQVPFDGGDNNKNLVRLVVESKNLLGFVKKLKKRGASVNPIDLCNLKLSPYMHKQVQERLEQCESRRRESKIKIEKWTEQTLKKIDEERDEEVRGLLEAKAIESVGKDWLEELAYSGIFPAYVSPLDLLRENPQLFGSPFSKKKFQFFMEEYTPNDPEDLKQMLCGKKGEDFEKIQQFKALYEVGLQLALTPEELNGSESNLRYFIEQSKDFGDFRQKLEKNKVSVKSVVDTYGLKLPEHLIQKTQEKLKKLEK